MNILVGTLLDKHDNAETSWKYAFLRINTISQLTLTNENNITNMFFLRRVKYLGKWNYLS